MPPIRTTSHPDAPRYFLHLRLLLVAAGALLALGGWPPAVAALLGALAIGGRRLQLDLRAERRERLEGLAGAEASPRLQRALSRLARPHGVSVPPVYLVDEPSLGASVCGARRGDAAILVGRELVGALKGRALQAMLAHELGHATHRDVALGITLRAVAAAFGGALLGALAGTTPLGILVALGLIPVAPRLHGWADVRLARIVERRADRFAVRLVGATALAGALVATNRRERAQLALTMALEHAGAAGLGARRIERVSARLLDPSSTTRALITAERSLTRDLKHGAQAEVRAARRRDPWPAGGVYGTLRERLGRIRG